MRQTPLLVTVPVEVMVTLLPQQEEAIGGSNVQLLPHCTVLLVGQVMVRQVLVQQIALPLTSTRSPVGPNPMLVTEKSSVFCPATKPVVMVNGCQVVKLPEPPPVSVATGVGLPLRSIAPLL